MNFLDNLMSPLNRDHCLLFYYLGLISLLFAVLGLGSLVYNVLSGSKTDRVTLTFFYSFLSNLVMYYISRLNYSICLGALQ
jgi:hypothetical protein